MGDFLVQYANENRVGVIADRHGYAVGKDNIAVGVEIVIIPLINVTLRCDGLDKGHISFAVIDGSHAVRHIVIITQLLCRIGPLDMYLTVEMCTGAGNNRLFGQGLILTLNGYIVQFKVGDGQIGIMRPCPVVVGVKIHDHIDFSIGQGIHHTLMCGFRGNGQGNAQIIFNSFDDMGNNALRLSVLQISIGRLIGRYHDTDNRISSKIVFLFGG